MNEYPKFHPFTDESGKRIPGCYVSDLCRVEKTDEGWCAQVPMRRIGQSAFGEFRPIAAGGAWTGIGTYRIKDGAMSAAIRLQSGVFVWRYPYSDPVGTVPGEMIEFCKVVDDIKASQE